jgi:hypothetical protein
MSRRDEAERLERDRERFLAQHYARPDPGGLIVLNFADRDAAREVYQSMEAVMKVGYQKRTGEPFPLDGLNSAHVVDEIIHAINLSRVRQAETNLVCLRDEQVLR